MYEKESQEFREQVMQASHLDRSTFFQIGTTKAFGFYTPETTTLTPTADLSNFFYEMEHGKGIWRIS